MEKLLVGHDENELCNLHQMIVELLLGEYVQTLKKTREVFVVHEIASLENKNHALSFRR